MEKLIFKTSESDSLTDIFFKARNTIVENRLRVIYLVIKPIEESKKENYSDIEIAASFQIPSPNKICGIQTKVRKKAPLEEQTSKESIRETIEQFGGNDYMNLTLREEKNFPKDKYEITIFESNSDQIHEVKLPQEITKKDLSHLIELLEILKIPYQTKDDIFKVIPNQPWKTLTYKIQARAYLWALNNNFSPHLYSSSRLDYENKRVASLSENIYKYHFIDETKKIKYISVETQNYYSELTKEEISKIEKFATENLGIQLYNMHSAP